MKTMILAKARWLAQNKRRWLTFFLLAAAIHVIAFSVLCAKPFPYGSGGPTSPRLYQPSIDIPFYLEYAKLYRDDPAEVFGRIVAFYTNLGKKDNDLYVSGPVFPSLLILTGYKEGNTLPLSLVILMFGIVFSGLWLFWLDKNGVAAGWMLLFTGMPHFIWFAIQPNSDIVFSVIFGFFFLIYFRERGNPVRIKHDVMAYLLVLLLLATRPTGISVALFLCLDRAWEYLGGKRKSWIPMASAVVITVGLGLVLLPYFVTYVRLTFAQEVFGVTVLGADGDGPKSLLEAIAMLGRIVFVMVGKTLYVVGIHPSQSGLVAGVVIRAPFGALLYVGLIRLLVKGDRSRRILIVTGLLPIMFGIAIWRYLLPFMPILFREGTQFVEELREKWFPKEARSGMVTP